LIDCVWPLAVIDRGTVAGGSCRIGMLCVVQEKHVVVIDEYCEHWW